MRQQLGSPEMDHGCFVETGSGSKTCARNTNERISNCAKGCSPSPGMYGITSLEYKVALERDIYAIQHTEEIDINTHEFSSNNLEKAQTMETPKTKEENKMKKKSTNRGVE